MSDLGWLNPIIRPRNILSSALMTKRMNLEEWLATYEPSAPAFPILVRRFPQDHHWRWYLNRLWFAHRSFALHDPPEGASPPAQTTLLGAFHFVIKGTIMCRRYFQACLSSAPSSNWTWKCSFGRLATHKPRFIKRILVRGVNLHFYHSAPPFRGSVAANPNSPSSGLFT